MSGSVVLTAGSSVNDVIAWLVSLQPDLAKYQEVARRLEIDGCTVLGLSDPQLLVDMLGVKSIGHKHVIKKGFLWQIEKADEIPEYDAEEELQNEREAQLQRRSVSLSPVKGAAPDSSPSPMSHQGDRATGGDTDTGGGEVEMIEEYDAEEEQQVEWARRSIHKQVELNKQKSATMLLDDATAKLDSSNAGALIGSPVSWKHEVQARQLREQLRDHLETEVVLTSMLSSLTVQSSKGKQKADKGKAKVSKSEIKKRVANLTTDIDRAKAESGALKAKIADLHKDWKFGSTLEGFGRATGVAVPPVVPSCVETLKRVGLREEGLFRIPGDKYAVDKLKAGFEIGGDPLSVGTNTDADAAVIASTLKLFLRSLEDPVMTYALYKDFVATASIRSDSERQTRLSHLVFRELPRVHSRILDILIPFLQTVSETSDTNKMTQRNLAVVFGPTLLHADPKDMHAMIRDAANVNMVIEYLIRHWDAIKALPLGGSSQAMDVSSDGTPTTPFAAATAPAAAAEDAGNDGFPDGFDDGTFDSSESKSHPAVPPRLLDDGGGVGVGDDAHSDEDGDFDGVLDGDLPTNRRRESSC